MKRGLFLASILLFSEFTLMADFDDSDSWSPVPGTMLTRWGRDLSPETAWREYPRPQLVRDNWENLNGLWDYAVTGIDAPAPEAFSGKILVPFCIESPLSGVGHLLEPDEALWYHRTVDLEYVPGKRLMLNFEAVDYACKLWINGQLVGAHTGGNVPFSFEITDAARDGNNEILLQVVDATDAKGTYQLHGKQRLENKGIYYTRVSGIWQSVWLETVPQSYIGSIAVTTAMEGRVEIRTCLEGADLPHINIKAFVSLNGLKVDTVEGGAELGFRIEDPQLWSPDNPVLYDVVLQLRDGDGGVLDTVESYFGIREVGSIENPDTGERAFSLNGEPLFHWGPLDQGWWPDGLLTPPSEQAIKFELRFLKEAGFNMLRKHVKVESRRYYALCDRIGLLVWQDHVPGGTSPKWKRLEMVFDEDFVPDKHAKHARPDDPLESDWPPEAHTQFMVELEAMMDTLHNHPCIVVWVPFNERWGQHKTAATGQWVKERDPSRHVNIASGGNFVPVGDIADQHDYPDPSFPFHIPDYDGFIKVIGEFGGHGYPVEGHLWDPEKRNWGYGGLPKTADEYRERYVRTAKLLGAFRERGIAAGVYTQTSDVEGEINGLLTYDREVLKLSAEELRAIHREAGLPE